MSAQFDDGSWQREAFEYDWRVWPVEEMLEVLSEAGFAWTGVCVDDVGAEGYSHVFNPLVGHHAFQQAVQDEDFYSCYIVSCKSTPQTVRPTDHEKGSTDFTA